jgi:hypothetical protein
VHRPGLHPQRHHHARLRQALTRHRRQRFTRSLDRQRVDIRLHQRIKDCVDRTMPRQRRHAGEDGADDPHCEMPTTIFGTFVTGMAVAVIDDVQHRRRECGLQQTADRFDPRLARQWARNRTHGSTGRNGRTSTRAYTPAST